ncbi:MAG: hypothetical protein A2Y10_09115 [Planctomycetes bacterium GWF2_41_51]|nr:MAG: hypothetical protein A2Y10_09115 [Planctomycetes bacterium GWF2_41_51]
MLNRSDSGDKTGTVRIPPETIEMIQKIASEMGYKPNRSALELRGQRSYVIGMLMQPPGQRLFYERFARLLIMEQIAYQRGYRIIIGHLFSARQQINDYVDDFLSRRVDGVLCLAHYLGDQSHLITGRLAVLPNVVYFNKPLGVSNAYYVGTDYSDGIEQLIAHFVSKGRRNIGIALMGRKYYPMTERIKGYESGLKKADIEYDEKKVWAGPETMILTEELLDQMVSKLVETAKVDAIIAADDEWACLIMKRLHNRGIRIPEDIALAGYDNMSMSTLVTPSLTTVDCNYELIGKAMIDMLLELIEKTDSEKAKMQKHFIVKPRLIVREST